MWFTFQYHACNYTKRLLPIPSQKQSKVIILYFGRSLKNVIKYSKLFNIYLRVAKFKQYFNQSLCDEYILEHVIAIGKKNSVNVPSISFLKECI